MIHILKLIVSASFFRIGLVIGRKIPDRELKLSDGPAVIRFQIDQGHALFKFIMGLMRYAELVGRDRHFRGRVHRIHRSSGLGEKKSKSQTTATGKRDWFPDLI